MLANQENDTRRSRVLVQLLYFPGCPHLDAARRALHDALSSAKEATEVVEVDVTAPDTPADLRSWGSPTILVDGRDVAGESPSGSSCRLYRGPQLAGVPSRHLIEAALRAR
jgi:mercuric ion transport protein